MNNIDILILLLAVPVILGCRFLNRVRGDGENYKWLPQKRNLCITGIALLCAIPISLRAYQAHGAIWLDLAEWASSRCGVTPLWAQTIAWSIIALGLIVFVAAFFALLTPSWGEIFVQPLDTFKKGYAFLVREIANMAAGYQYDEVVAKDDVREMYWKMTAWVGRFGVYGLPLAGISAWLVQSPAVILTWIGLSLWAGWVYMRAYLNRKGSESETVDAERGVGALIGLYAVIVSLA